LIKGVTESGLLLEVLKRFARCDELHGIDIGTLLYQPCETLGFARRSCAFEVDRKIECIVPALTDRAGVLDDEIERSRNRERDRDHEDDHQACERLSEQAAE